MHNSVCGIGWFDFGKPIGNNHCGIEVKKVCGYDDRR